MNRVRGLLIDTGKVILIKRVKDNETYYVIPGGGIEKGESDSQALQRECKEELGLAIEIIKPMLKRNFKGQREIFYLCSIISGKLGTGNGPEFKPDSGYEGAHIIESVAFEDISKINLKPAQIKNELLNFIAEFGKKI